LLFHSLAEMFSIVVACAIFILAWNTRRFQENGYLLFIGIAQLFIGGLDLLHTLSFKGMGVFPSYDANLPTQLWIASRYIQSISLLAAPLFLYPLFSLRGRQQPYLVAGFFLALTTLVLLSIFAWNIFPTSYVEGVGQTAFKKTSEYVISAIYLAAAAVLWAHRRMFDRQVLVWLQLSIFTCIITELVFTGYIQVTDAMNMAGHLFKILSIYFIYKAIVETGFIRPYNLLFRNLKQSESDLRSAHEELEDRVHQRTMEVVRANKALLEEVEEHMRTEAELRRYRERLEVLVQERTAELQREVNERERAEAAVKIYAAQLEDSNRELQNFALIASHDLQEPLRKIIAFGDRLKSGASGQLGADERSFIERMQQAAKRMQAMIEALLAYSRVTTKAQPFMQVDLDKVANDVLSDLEVRIEQTEGQVSVDGLAEIEADPMQMHQLFQNLIANALKFHRPGTPPRVQVHGFMVGNGPPAARRLCIEVSDNGIGFEEHYLERLFQPFQRLVGRSEYEGSGMGLAICRKIAERHGGSITARSVPNQGTVFTIELPVRQMGTIPSDDYS